MKLTTDTVQGARSNSPFLLCLFLATGITLFFSGCAKNPATGKTEAEVKDAGTSTAAKADAKPSAAAARTYKVEPDSTIAFVGSKVTGSHNGGFKKFSGQFALSDGALAGTDNKITIEMDSLFTDTDRLTGHLKTPDFFDVQTYPQAVFEPTAIEKLEGSKIKLTGNLTLHGVTKQISFPGELSVQGDEAILKAEFYIKRFDFNVKYPGKANDLIRDEVVLKLDVKAKAA